MFHHQPTEILENKENNFKDCKEIGTSHDISFGNEDKILPAKQSNEIGINWNSRNNPMETTKNFIEREREKEIRKRSLPAERRGDDWRPRFCCFGLIGEVWRRRGWWRRVGGEGFNGRAGGDWWWRRDFRRSEMGESRRDFTRRGGRNWGKFGGKLGHADGRKNLGKILGNLGFF